MVWNDDPEQARLQRINLNVWLASLTVVFFSSVAISVVSPTYGILWGSTVLPLGLAAAAVARLPRYFTRVTGTMYALVGAYGTYLLYTLPEQLFQGYNSIWAVFAAVAIADRPRRAILLGALSLAAILGTVVHGPEATRYALSASSAALGLVLCAHVGNRSWNATAAHLVSATRRNNQLIEQLEAANAELEHKVAARTDDLQARQEQALRNTVHLDETLRKRAALTEKLHELAMRDDLTGMWNRRSFMSALNEVPWADGKPVTVLLLDVDHFKSVNDTHGHAAGDEVLRLIGGALAEAMRTDDVVARIGGEEFAVLLPGTKEADGRAIAETLRRVVERIELDDDHPQRVTISIGGVTVAGWAQDPSILLTHADAALYEAKANGRNQVAWNARVSEPTP